jgi:hypothetical protein
MVYVSAVSPVGNFDADSDDGAANRARKQGTQTRTVGRVRKWYHECEIAYSKY